jgi:hypothetical protein
MTKVFVGDVGTEIRLAAGQDLTEADLIHINYAKPSGQTGFWVGYADETDGCYITQSDDLDEAGMWRLQLYVELSDWKGHGDIEELQVYENLR